MRYVYLVFSVLMLSGCREQANGQRGVDWLARTIAIVGAIVGVGGLALGIWNYFWDRRKFEIMRKERLEDKEERRREKDEEANAKAEQGKERVTAELVIMGTLDEKKEPRYVWAARIYNPTGFVIPIKRVTLVFMDNITPKQERKVDTKSVDLTPRKTNSEAFVKFGPGDHVNQPQPLPELEPRKEVICLTDGFAKFVVEDIASQAPDDVDITIYSHTGVIERIKGDVIIAECKKALAESIRA